MSLNPALPIKAVLVISLLVGFAGYQISAGISLPPLASAPKVEQNDIQTDGQSVVNDRALPISQTDDQTKDHLSCAVSEKFPESIRQWCNLITDYATQHGLEPDLVAALIWQESGGNPSAYSHSGAVGLMQVMPRDGLAAKFMCKNGPCFRNRPTIQELQDAAFNVSYGAAMLAGLYQKFGSLREALKHYGPMDVGYYYADKVLGIYQKYKK